MQPQRITSPHNPRVGWLRTLQTPRGRREAGAWLVEGPHLIQDALRFGCVPSLILYDPETLDPALTAQIQSLDAARYETLIASPPVIARVSTTQTPQPIVAAIPLDAVAPDILVAHRPARPRPVVLVLDDISDPGNMGTILRTALAADVDRVVLTPDCVDPFSPKVVRAASGAHFRLPLVLNQSLENIPHAPDATIVIADSNATAAYTALDYTRPTLLIMGNEAHGPSPAARKLATRTILIPMANEVESLNVAIATSIILFEAVRQQQNVTKGL